MHSLPTLIYDLAIMLGFASIVAIIFRRIGQPVVLGYLLVGIIIGPFTPPHAFVDDIPNIKILSELGVIFLIFSLGLEFNFHKLARVGFSATITGVLEVVSMTAIGFLIGKLLGWSYNDAIFLGAALSISSTTIIIKAIEELGLMRRRFADLVFGILVVEDLLAILLLVLLPATIKTHSIFSFDMLWHTGKLIVIVCSWFIIGYFLIPTLHRKMLPFANNETITIVSIGLCLLLVSLAAYFDFSTALGAFIMGSILAETPAIQRIRTLVQPVRDMFAAVFFISIGMLMDPSVVISEWPIVLLIALITVIAKILATGISVFATGQRLDTAIKAGFSMAQIGEFSFIIVSLGLTLNAINSTLYPIIVTVSVLTTFTTPHLIKLSLVLSKRIEQSISDEMRSFLDSYSSAIYELMEGQRHSAEKKKLVMRLFLNGIMVALIFTAAYTLLLPVAFEYMPKAWQANFITWLVSLIFSAPFLWGMIFSAHPTREQKRLHFNLSHFLAWVVTFFEVTFLSFLYFHTWPVLFALVLGIASFIVIAYRQLESTYRWFEKGLVDNIQASGSRMQKFHALAPWDTFLVEIEVGIKTPLAGKTLKIAKIREKFDVNIVAIQRGGNIIFAPRGEDRIMSGDKLVILGEEDQIESFKQCVEEQNGLHEPIDLLENVSMKTLILDKRSPYIGKTIRGSNLREEVNGLIVGLEREGKRILNPDPSLTLKTGDLLFIAGETSRLASL